MIVLTICVRITWILFIFFVLSIVIHSENAYAVEKPQSELDVIILPETISTFAGKKIEITIIVTNNQKIDAEIGKPVIIGNMTEINFVEKFETKILQSNSSLPIFGTIQIPNNTAVGSYILTTLIEDKEGNTGISWFNVSIAETPSTKPDIGLKLDSVLLLLAAFLIPSQIIERIVVARKSFHLGDKEHREEHFNPDEKIAVLTKMRDKLAEKLGSAPLKTPNIILEFRQKFILEKLETTIDDHNKYVKRLSEEEQKKEKKFEITKEEIEKTITIEDEYDKLKELLTKKGIEQNEIDKINAIYTDLKVTIQQNKNLIESYAEYEKRSDNVSRV